MKTLNKISNIFLYILSAIFVFLGGYIIVQGTISGVAEVYRLSQNPYAIIQEYALRIAIFFIWFIGSIFIYHGIAAFMYAKKKALYKVCFIMDFIFSILFSASSSLCLFIRAGLLGDLRRFAIYPFLIAIPFLIHLLLLVTQSKLNKKIMHKKSSYKRGLFI